MKYAEAGNTILNMSYPVFSENMSIKMDVCVFNTEYRVLQKMKRIGAEFPIGRKRRFHSMMRELLASANGATAYDFPLEILFGHPKEYSNGLKNPDFIPMTIIAWKTFSGRVFCSVELIFLKWDSAFSLEDNLSFNGYMERSDQVASKLVKECYETVAVIGKGDYVKTLRKVFADQFGYTVI
jgi:hypothetical protein